MSARRPLGPVVRWDVPRICIECGDDEAVEGYELCADCLEELEGRRS